MQKSSLLSQLYIQQAACKGLREEWEALVRKQNILQSHASHPHTEAGAASVAPGDTQARIKALWPCPGEKLKEFPPFMLILGNPDFSRLVKNKDYYFYFIVITITMSRYV